MKKLILAFALSMFGMSAAIAGDGSSGCGAGWYLFPKNSLVSSSFRTTTNNFSGIATFGMSSGTSNCAKHDIVMNEKEAVYFAEANQQNLEIELAEGKGEFVSAFARTLGCDDSVTADFGRAMQSNYSSIVTPNATPDQMLQNVKQQIRAVPSLAGNCSRV